MTVPLTSTVIVLGPSAADSNACTGTVLPINLSHRECRLFQPWRLPQSRRTAVDPDPTRKQTAVHSPALTQPRPRPPQSLGHYPHSAQPPAASFNPASMRSRSHSALNDYPVPRDLTEPSRFPNQRLSDS